MITKRNEKKSLSSFFMPKQEKKKKRKTIRKKCQNDRNFQEKVFVTFIIIKFLIENSYILYWLYHLCVYVCVTN